MGAGGVCYKQAVPERIEGNEFRGGMEEGSFAKRTTQWSAHYKPSPFSSLHNLQQNLHCSPKFGLKNGEEGLGSQHLECHGLCGSFLSTLLSPEIPSGRALSVEVAQRLERKAQVLNPLAHRVGINARMSDAMTTKLQLLQR